MSKLHVFFAVTFIIFFLGILWFLGPLFIEGYCQNQAKKIVGNQWNKIYEAEGYEKKYVKEIFWGFREELKCERKFGLGQNVMPNFKSLLKKLIN